MKTKLKNKRSQSLITLNAPKSVISEQYRNIRTNIQYSSVDSEINSILITSSEPGDGKTTTISNLAVTFASLGNRVLLIDADLRKPQLHHVFKLDNHEGLSTMLSKNLPLSETVQKTQSVNLDVLTSGPIPPNPSELLSSKKMELLIAQMKESYDYVLFDTPPILAVSDAQIVTRYCDGTLLVVKSNKTEKENIKKAKELLEFTNSNLMGVVLNGVKENKSTYYYYGE